MKPTLLTTLSFLLFALTTYFPLAFTKYVYDTDGYPLAPGYKYYISQTTTSGQEGGALILGETETGGGGVEACALTVLQEFCEDDDGLPVRFNVSDGGYVISEDLNVEIEFVSDEKPCAQSSKWVVVENPLIFNSKWISIGSSEDLGDVTQIMDGVFKIKEQGLGYKLVFFSKWSRTYFDIKRYNDVDGRRLVAINFESKKYHPFEVEFVNAKRYRRSVV
ncbi:kunitz-type trypsin inhibitor-like 2 protein [Trifolium pratense]|uniref:Kunitz-type trypsin inhibitor-like 2 protein n=1 Tax=Trifolium pratense TaxID=57577 RepID=A0A2K3JRA4_TRIPR|nr:kunitz-type trypsin inhibitor-like 2 protein [Trifolium pratense]